MILEASVVIPTYDDWHVLPKCLDCLANQSVSLGRFEVIVANNNASAKVPADLRLSPNVRVIHVPKPGSYAARNAAVRDARGKVLFFTDSDCLPDPHWIENGLSALAGLRPIDRIAGGIELFPKGETWTSPELLDRTFALRQSAYASQGWCATANLVTTREAFDLVGPFDEGSFSGGDVEWGKRATELGSLIFLSEKTLIRHPAREDFAALAKKRRRLVGYLYDREMTTGAREASTVSYLFPDFDEFGWTARDGSLTETEKMAVLWIQYRLRLVAFREFVRLRYRRGTPTRS
ncbi:MAG: glycosyltransferase [Rhodobacterales bacterium]|nr:glycosyltransferase [Rhodobacterales bacterium]